MWYHMTLYTELGMGLIYVGFVLVINGLWLLGYGEGRDVAIMNFFTGGVTFLIAMWWAFGGIGGQASEGTAFNAAGTLLFSFTYIWVGINAHRGLEDQRALGWYCILVTVVAIPTGWLVWQIGDIGLALLWWVWAILWATFWVLLGLERSKYTKPIAWFTILVGLVSGAAGYLMGAGLWPWV